MNMWKGQTMIRQQLTRQQRWYRENKDRSLANDKRWRAENREKVAERNRRYREKFFAKHGMTPSQYYSRKKNSGLSEG